MLNETLKLSGGEKTCVIELQLMEGKYKRDGKQTNFLKHFHLASDGPQQTLVINLINIIRWHTETIPIFCLPLSPPASYLCVTLNLWLFVLLTTNTHTYTQIERELSGLSTTLSFPEIAS